MDESAAERTKLPAGSHIVVAAFTTSGVVHLVRPQVFVPLIPRALGPATPWVIASGVAELGCAAGLATRRPWAPAATTATLAAIWVGNWSMALKWQRSERRSTAQKVVGWARLPLQVPLMVWAWKSPVVSSPRRLDP